MVQDESMLRKQENQKLIAEQSNVFSLLAEKKELERRVTNLTKQSLGMINFDLKKIDLQGCKLHK